MHPHPTAFFVLSVLLASLCAPSLAQRAAPGASRLVLKDGRQFEGALAYVDPPGQLPYLLLDREERFEAADVLRFSSPSGDVFAPKQIFVRGGSLGERYQYVIFKRTRAGRIELFTRVEELRDDPPVRYRYFAELGGPVREADFGVLMEVLRDDARARRIMKRQKWYRVAAVAFVAVGISWSLYDNKTRTDQLKAEQRRTGPPRMPYENAALPGTAIIAAAAIPLGLSLTAKRRAIRAYNAGR